MSYRIVALLVLVTLAAATPTLRLRRGDFVLPTKASKGAPEIMGWHQHSTGHAQMIVHVDEPSGTNADSISRTLEHSATTYMSENAYLVYATRQEAEAISKLSFVHHVGLWHPSFKTDSNMDKELATHRSVKSLSTINQDINTENLFKDNAHVLRLVVTFALEALDVQQAEAAVNTWKVEWNKRNLPSQQWTIMYLSKNEAHLAVYVSHASQLVSILSESPQVHFVDKRHATRTFNSESSRLVQSRTTTSTPLWDKGLTGTGQIIGGSDSGIDLNSAFFYNNTSDSYNFFQGCTITQLFFTNGTRIPGSPNCSTANLTASTTLNPNHRKVLGYWSWLNNNVDYYNGHGTHVLGTAMGAPYASAPSALTDFRGIAHASKLIFCDIGSPALLGSDGATFPPPELDLNFLPYWTSKGAYIHTNSWGGGASAYSAEAVSVDRFAKSNPNFLLLWAGGNSGTNGASSISAQSNCKNCIVVGSHKTSAAHFNASTINVGTVSELVAGEALKVSVCDSTYWTTARSSLSGGNPLGYLDTASDALSNNTAAGYVAEYCPRATSNITTLCCDVATAAANTIDNFLSNILVAEEAICCPASIKTSVDNAAASAGIGVLSAFSSYGPASGARLKPDFVGAGETILSARGTADSLVKNSLTNASTGALYHSAGTSQATPSIAGAAALVRQFYTDGYAKCQAACSAQGVTPSMALIKATMMQTTVNLNNATNQAAFEKQGYGALKLIDMFDSIYDTNTKIIKTYFYDYTDSSNDAFNATGTPKCINYTGTLASTALTASLVWVDTAGTVSSSNPIVNDLDLYVTDGTTTYWGNHFIYGNTADNKNTNEKVILTGAQGLGNQTQVCVRATTLPGSAQGYALVVRLHEAYTPTSPGFAAVPSFIAVILVLVSIFMA